MKLRDGRLLALLSGRFAIFCDTAVSTMYECRSIYDMCTGIAQRLGVEQAFTEGRDQQVWINPMDAEKREIKDGDMLKVWNDRGEIRVQAKVTERIMPGVVAMGQGSWYAPDRKGVERC